MTISTQNRTAGPFAGNGVASSFPFTFKVFQASDLKVVRRTISTDTEATLVLNANYTVALNPNQNANPGGSINLPGALSVDETLTITTELAYLQQTELTNQGGFYPQVITNALDRLTIFTQQLFTGLNRSLKYPLSDSGIDPTLPGKNTLRGRVLAFHETTGRPIAGPTTTSVGTVAGGIAAIQTVADNIADVNTVADNIGDVNAVGQSIGDVNDIADNLTAVQTVATNISKVNTVAFNINDVTNFADVYLGPRTADPSTRSDGSPLSQGDLYFNTSTNRLRVYTGAQWSEANAGAVSVQQFTGDGVTVDFQLNSAADNENVVQVFVGGVYQSKTVYDITGANADIISFVSPPPNGVAIEAVTFSVLPLGVVDASQVQMPGGGTLDELGAPDSVVKVGGVQARTLSYDVFKYNAIKDAMDGVAKAANVLAFNSAIANHLNVTARDGVYYVNDTIELGALTDLDLSGCVIVAQGMTGKPLFKASASGGITKEVITITGGYIQGDAEYFLELEGLTDAPVGVGDYTRVVKVTGTTIISLLPSFMRGIKANKAVKSLFLSNLYHYGGSFFVSDGKTVETHLSNSLIFGNGGDTIGFNISSSGGGFKYNEGLHVSNCTIDGYAEQFRLRDVFVGAVTNSYIGTNSIAVKVMQPTTTTHSREMSFTGGVWGGKLVFEPSSVGLRAHAVINGVVFAGCPGSAIEIGNNWNNIRIANCKGETNQIAGEPMIKVGNNCGNITINDVDSDETYNGTVVVSGVNGAALNFSNIHADAGRAVTSSRPCKVNNPSLNGVNDVDLRRYSARIPVAIGVAAGASLGSVGVSLAKGQVGTIKIGGLVADTASYSALSLSGISGLSLAEGSGWSSAFKEMSAGVNIIEWSVDFIAKEDIPFVAIGVTNGSAVTTQAGNHAYISVIKEL